MAKQLKFFVDGTSLTPAEEKELKRGLKNHSISSESVPELGDRALVFGDVIKGKPTVKSPAIKKSQVIKKNPPKPRGSGR